MTKIMLFLMITFSVHGANCEKILAGTGIDFDIKANKGWHRVCNNRKLGRFLTNGRNKHYVICYCIKDKFKINDTKSLEQLLMLRGAGND